jgi:protein involved in polysaccharide export with SLBB domain
VLLSVGLSGCSSLYRQAIPASCVSPSVPAAPRGGKAPIDFGLLAQDPPSVYLIGPRDVLGIYIEGILGGRGESPPVHFTQPGEENLPPSIGYPIPVREDGTISLPLVPPIRVAGLTMAQVEEEIRVAYMVQREILQPGTQRILVTLMKPRTYSVLVIREDTSMIGGLPSQSEATQGLLGAATLGTTKFGATHLVELPAYQNDVLHALSKGGGLPGLDAVNEVMVLHGGFKTAEQRDRIRNDPAWKANWENDPSVTKIPLRISSHDPPLQLTRQDILLDTGDIIYIKGREAEIFYTGGLLPGKQIPVPRDYDLDVLGAIAMAGGSVAAAPGGTGAQSINGGRGVGSIFPPTRVIVLRTIDGKQIPIKLSLKKALQDPDNRILIQPNDYILLEYTDMELVMNLVLSTVTLNYSLNR